MSKNIIKLMSLLNESLLEIGDLKNIQSYPFSSARKGRYVIDIEDGDKVDVIFSKVGEDERQYLRVAPIFKKSEINDFYNLGYSIKGISTQAKESNVKELLKIMSTLMLITKDFLKGKELTGILLFEENKKESLGYTSGQKSLLYRSVVSQNLPSDYISGPAEFMGIKGIVIGPKL